MTTLSHPDFNPADSDFSNTPVSNTGPPSPPWDILAPLRHWFDQIIPNRPWQAHLICRLMPPTCPFERTIALCGHPLFHIPPLCKINPLYEEFIALRFRALSYLADICQEDIRQYI